MNLYRLVRVWAPFASVHWFAILVVCCLGLPPLWLVVLREARRLPLAELQFLAARLALYVTEHRAICELLRRDPLAGFFADPVARRFSGVASRLIGAAPRVSIGVYCETADAPRVCERPLDSQGRSYVDLDDRAYRLTPENRLTIIKNIVSSYAASNQFQTEENSPRKSWLSPACSRGKSEFAR